MSNFLMTAGVWLGFISFIAILILTFILAIHKFQKKQVGNSKKAFIFSLATFGVSILLIFGSFLTFASEDETTSTEQAETKDTQDSLSSALDKPITKKQYQQIKIGMTNKEVEKLLKKPSDDNIIDLSDEYEWNYNSTNDGLAYITFDNSTNKVVEKSEIGLLSDSSSTITDTKGTRESNYSDDSTESSNDDYQYEVESTIESVIDEDFTFDTSLIELELNKNAGTDEEDDYVALIYLSYDQVHSEETTKKWIDDYTSHLAAKLAEIEPDITSLSIFWETPRFKEDWNTAKFNLTKKDNTFYFDSENYDETVFK